MIDNVKRVGFAMSRITRQLQVFSMRRQRVEHLPVAFRLNNESVVSADAFSQLGITMRDHITIGKSGHTSMRGLKLIQ